MRVACTRCESRFMILHVSNESLTGYKFHDTHHLTCTVPCHIRHTPGSITSLHLNVMVCWRMLSLAVQAALCSLTLCRLLRAYVSVQESNAYADRGVGKSPRLAASERVKTPRCRACRTCGHERRCPGRHWRTPAGGQHTCRAASRRELVYAGRQDLARRAILLRIACSRCHNEWAGQGRAGQPD